MKVLLTFCFVVPLVGVQSEGDIKCTNERRTFSTQITNRYLTVDFALPPPVQVSQPDSPVFYHYYKVLFMIIDTQSSKS